MTHADLVAALERERISYPDQLEAERYAPEPVERIAGVRAPYTPVTEQRAKQNRARLAMTLHNADPRTTTNGQKVS
jgi:hypothetical protein